VGDRAGSGGGGAPEVAGGGGAAGGEAGASGSGGDGTDETDREWATWPMPNWVDFALPNTPHYSLLDDGTVRDDVTELVWATTRSDTVSWPLALEVCASGFRLPTIIELVSIANPATTRVDAVFNLGPQSLWSSSPVVDTPESAWMLYGGGDGSTYPWQVIQRYPVICVRGGKRAGAQAHYELTQVGSTPAVRDNWTGLVWQQGTSSRTYEFDEAQEYCRGLDAGFRAPSMKELQTLIDRRRAAPSIDPTYFPETPSAHFWSGTRQSELIAYAVAFKIGSANTYSTDSPGYMRCVH
jgi:hypothetical protein